MGKFQTGHAPSPNSGRPKGSRNKIAGKELSEIIAGGETPLEFLVRTYQDESREYSVRLDAAKSAAPYAHPKLQNIDINGALNSTIVIRHDWKGKQPSEG